MEEKMRKTKYQICERDILLNMAIYIHVMVEQEKSYINTTYTYKHTWEKYGIRVKI